MTDCEQQASTEAIDCLRQHCMCKVQFCMLAAAELSSRNERCTSDISRWPWLTQALSNGMRPSGGGAHAPPPHLRPALQAQPPPNRLPVNGVRHIRPQSNPTLMHAKPNGWVSQQRASSVFMLTIGYCINLLCPDLSMSSSEVNADDPTKL